MFETSLNNMGKKKKPFIDKKNAATFNLIYRDQSPSELFNRDEKNNEQSRYVLQPTPHHSKLYEPVPIPKDFPKDLLPSSEIYSNTKSMGPPYPFQEEELKKNTLYHDYDYSQHLMSMSSNNVVMTKDAKHVSLRDKKVLEDTDHYGGDPNLRKKIEKELKKLPKDKNETISKDFFDALVDAEEEIGEYEEIQDDFIIAAMGGIDFTADDDDNDDEDNDNEDDNNEDDNNEDDILDAKEYINDNIEANKYNNDDYDERPRQYIDDAFDRLMNEIDDDDEYEVDPDDPDIQGHIEDVFSYPGIQEEFDKQQKKKAKDHEKADKETKNLLTKALENMHLNDELIKANDNNSLQFTNDEYTAQQVVVMDDPYKIEAMFPQRQKEKWDVESILSTYSNLDNHPTMIKVPKKDKSKHIQLDKRGFPILKKDLDRRAELEKQFLARRNMTMNKIIEVDEKVEDESNDDLNNEIKENYGKKRNKHETKAEKKARKQKAKELRMQARLKKKKRING